MRGSANSAAVRLIRRRTARRRPAGIRRRKGVRGMKSVTTTNKTVFEIRNEIVKLLADEGCTVKQAKYILEQASRAITATATVQPVEGTDYEF